MKRVLSTVAIILILTANSFSQSGWRQLTSGVANHLNSVFFINNNTGYVCGTSGTILKTTNAGDNWFQLPSGTTNELTDISCRNDSVLFICGHNVLLRSENSGANWVNVFAGIYLSSVQCAGDVIYCGGANGVYKSTDGGETWTNTMSGFTESIWDIFFVNRDTGYAMGSNATQRRTTNGGSDWNGGLYWGPGIYGFSACRFFESGYGFVCYSFNSGWPNYYSSYGMYKADSWSSWHAVYNSPTSYLWSVFFPTVDTAFAVGGGWNGSVYQSLIIRSTNGGNNWHSQNFGGDKALYDVFFLDSRRGYAVGNSGTIITTESGGVVSVAEDPASVPDNYSLGQNYPNPFNPGTVIRYAIGSRSSITLKIRNMLGEEVAVLVNEVQEAGRHEVQFESNDLASGVYVYSLYIGDRLAESRKMIRLK
ncbi:MAG: T9SS type A sorting domain-containing protein [Ignavibacteria bacterium]|nr:T9SS type A sorting domain-containing protein [Ignavibacteria bacterium]